MKNNYVKSFVSVIFLISCCLGIWANSNINLPDTYTNVEKTTRPSIKNFQNSLREEFVVKQIDMSDIYMGKNSCDHVWRYEINVLKFTIYDNTLANGEKISTDDLRIFIKWSPNYTYTAIPNLLKDYNVCHKQYGSFLKVKVGEENIGRKISIPQDEYNREYLRNEKSRISVVIYKPKLHSFFGGVEEKLDYPFLAANIAPALRISQYYKSEVLCPFKNFGTYRNGGKSLLEITQKREGGKIADIVLNVQRWCCENCGWDPNVENTKF